MPETPAHGAVDGGGDEVRAAGAVLWRPGRRGVEVALVHRPRYDDWSFPKGKGEPGEHPLATAAREVAEETGLVPVLGRRLPTSRYRSDGSPKRVHYWAAQADRATAAGFVAGGEVDDLEWLPLAAARERLSYPRDVPVLDGFAAGPARTAAFILLRHARAAPKKAWRKAGWPDDLSRPLDDRGRAQARALAPLLGAFGTRRVASSAAERCVATVRPYAASAGAVIEAAPALTVGMASSAAVRDQARGLVGAGSATVVCAHRENLPALLAAACERFGAPAPDGPGLGKAAFWVLHMADGRLASAERHQAPRAAGDCR